jgi:hypothetical protein
MTKKPIKICFRVQCPDCKKVFEVVIPYGLIRDEALKTIRGKR